MTFFQKSLQALFVVIFSFSLGCSLNKKKVAVSPLPNIIHVMTDDGAADMLPGSARYPFLQMPAVARLMREGAIAENFFVSYSLCSPSRASVLTGTYAHTHGVTTHDTGMKMEPDWKKLPPFPGLLRDAGYTTAFVGKIHMADLTGTNQVRPGYDLWFSFTGQGEYFNPLLNENGREFRAQGYMTDLLHERALRWLENERDPAKPFCLILWHKAVHEDFSPAPRHRDQYAGEPLLPPPDGSHRETFRGKPEWLRARALGPGHTGPIPPELPEKPWVPRTNNILGMLRGMSAVDEGLGKILEYLDQANLATNTIVIFTSDNGSYLGSHTFYDKRLGYETAIRIPFILRYPAKVPAGSRMTEMGVNVDTSQTLLDWANVPAPAHQQGRSLAAAFEGKSTTSREDFLIEYYIDDHYPYAGTNMVAVRTPDWKLVQAEDAKPENIELYDLKKDPAELNNLASDPAYALVLRDMLTRFARLQEETRFTWDRDWRRREIVEQKKSR